MNEPHEAGGPPPEFGGREPNPFKKLEVMQARLDQKTESIKVLEAREVHLVALIDSVLQENAGLLAAMDQIRAENIILRRRLNLPEAGAIELTDEERVENGLTVEESGHGG